MLLSSEIPYSQGAFAVPKAGAMLLLLTWSGEAVLPESKNMCRRMIGVPQERGRSFRLLNEIPAGDTGLPTPGFGGALVRRGAKTTSER